MEIRQLQYFQSVARLEHITKAATQLFVAQSAVSRQIHLLEEELGAELFHREGRRIRLSRFGHRFLPYADRILRDVELANMEAQHFHDPNAGTVLLGFPHSIGIHYVPNLLASFQNEAPQVHFDLLQSRVSELLHRLRTGDLELAIISPWEGVQDTDDLDGTYLYRERLSIVIPTHHTLAAENSLLLHQLRDEPFILFKAGYTLRTLVWSACQNAGFEPRIALEVEETDTVRAFVKAGLGVSLLPDFPGDLSEGIRSVPIAGPVIERSIGIAWRRGGNLSGQARRFAEFARQRTEVADNSDIGNSK